MLGKIDDFDETYFNGVKIGETNDQKPFGWTTSYMQTRVYEIPKSLIKKGIPNVISVRVSDLGADAGIYSGPLAIIPKSH